MAENLFDEEKPRDESYNQTVTLNVTLQDRDLNQYVVKIKDPIPANSVSRAMVVSAFNNIIGGGTSGKQILYSRANVPFTTVGTIQYVIVATQKTDIE